MRRLKADDVHLAAAVKEAAAIIRRGGVVAFPTDTLYGLAVNPFDPAAVDRLFAVKGRAATQAVALVAADVQQVTQSISPLTGAARRLADAFWPGPLTLVLKPLVSQADGRLVLAPGIIAADGTVGVRVPAQAAATALCRACAHPLTATSANLSGEAATADPDVVWRALGGGVDLLLDGGLTPGGPPSTLVDASSDDIRLVRPGAIDWDTILRCVR